MKNLPQKTKAYALKNAIAYSGKAQQGAVISSLFNEGLKKEDVKKYIKKISEIIKEVNSMSLEEQKKEFEKLGNLVSERDVREGLPDLPGAKKGKVVMRFAPSPSGPFHVGHALTSCLSFLFVKKYGGKFYVRIEDTNPENIYEPAYKMIKEESDWLFEKKYELIVQSDRIEEGIYYEYAEKLINKKSAYICTCSGDEFREFVKKKKDCPCRKLGIKENLERWDKMLMMGPEGYDDGEAVLRFKSDMKHKNPAMRDFPLARINKTSHPRHGSILKVYPLMNMAVAVDDIEFGITHIVRAKEHRDNAERQKMIYKVLGKKFPWTAFLGRYKFKDLELSCSKTKVRIEKGEFTGWADPRLPFLASLKKKYKPQAFWKFAEIRGLSEADRVIDKKEFFKLLDTFNKIK